MIMTAQDPTQPLRRPAWDDAIDEGHYASSPVPVPASMPEPARTPSTRYTPVDDAKYQLGAGNMFVGVAAAAAFGSPFIAKMFDLHPAGYLYGYVWLAIALVTCVGLKTEETYPSEAVAWKASTNKMVAALMSVVLTILVWLAVWYIFA